MSREFKGNAIVTTLASGISAGDTSISIAAATNWPTGTGGDQFAILLISEDGTTREKVLIESRSGTTLTVATSGRGYDGTTAASFATGATVMHILDATFMQTLADHVNDETDNHTQYLNSTRHNALAHEFGAALGDPGDPEAVGTTLNEGVATAPARADHVHTIGAGAVSSPTMLADDVVTADKLADNAVTPGKIDTTTVSGDGIGLAFGILYIKTDGVTCHINGSGEIEVIGATVSTGGIADGAITTPKLADDAVTAAKIAADAVGASEIVAGGVGTTELADAAVTAAKLAASLPRGHIISDVKESTHTSTGAETTISSLSVNVTPVDANRKILLHFTSQAVDGATGDEQAAFRCKRDGANFGGIRYVKVGNNVDVWWADDSPAASLHTYTVSIDKTAGTSDVVVYGAAGQDAMRLEAYDMGAA